jgi:hypothetical protein
VSSDPRRFDGLYRSIGSTRESDATWKQGGETWQARWAWIVGPRMTLEGSLSRREGGIEITPTSGLFHKIPNPVRSLPQYGGPILQAVYPTRECSTDGTVSGFIPNCDPTKGRPSIYQVDWVNGGTSGPLWFQTDDSRILTTARADLTVAAPDLLGEHLLRSGIEVTDAKLDDDSVYNSFFQNFYQPCPWCTDLGGNPIPDAVIGYQILTVPLPSGNRQRADGSSYSGYVTDTWQPVPNVALRLGLRLDDQRLSSTGLTDFDPRAEKRRWNAIVEGLCADGLRIARHGSGQSTANAVCNPLAGFKPGGEPVGLLVYTFDVYTPVWLRKFDVDGDRIFHSIFDRVDGMPVWRAPLTGFTERRREDIEIHNVNLSPRIGVAWDPWSDGKTKLFGTWGRYYDRIFLAVAAHETAPVFAQFTFTPYPNQHKFLPGMLANSDGAVSIQQVSRDLKTPRTDELTLGVEREIAPEWTAKLTYVQRLAGDLHQDTDRNHILCTDFDEEFGIDPAQICQYFGSDGKVHLGDDLFGTLGMPQPNGAVDLYAVSPNFNQVLRVGNPGTARYRGVTLEIVRRQFRGWQMAGSYTYSRAVGQGLAFNALAGNDPANSGPERSETDFDQRHRVVLYGTVSLPRQADLGWAVRWESGTPYSVVEVKSDVDDRGNVNTRTVYPTGERNDQRNDGFWTVDARLSKRFPFGRLGITAELAVENLLDDDSVTLAGLQESNPFGAALDPGPGGLRRPGRIWEMGLIFRF